MKCEGGVLGGGSAVVYGPFHVAIDGGTVGGGSCDVGITSNISTSGGITLSGFCATEIYGEGGASIGGAAPIFLVPMQEAAGGVLSGSAALVVVYQPITIVVPAGRVQSELKGFYLVVQLEAGDGEHYVVDGQAIDVW